jgi:hypothetical protein
MCPTRVGGRANVHFVNSIELLHIDAHKIHTRRLYISTLLPSTSTMIVELLLEFILLAKMAWSISG